jgi:hypothetical protein
MSSSWCASTTSTMGAAGRPFIRRSRISLACKLEEDRGELFRDHNNTAQTNTATQTTRTVPKRVLRCDAGRLEDVVGAASIPYAIGYVWLPFLETL